MSKKPLAEPHFFGPALKKARIRTSFSQRALSKKIDKGFTSVSRWETGKVVAPDYETCKALEQVLECYPNELWREAVFERVYAYVGPEACEHLKWADDPEELLGQKNNWEEEKKKLIGRLEHLLEYALREIRELKS